MGFRDNADALLARAEALERENQELRKKVDEREDLENVEAENETLHTELAKLREQVDKDKASEDRHKAKEKAKAKAAKRTARKLKKDNKKLKGLLGMDGDEWESMIAVGVVCCFMLFGLYSQCGWSCSGNSTKVSLRDQRVKRVRVLQTGGPPVISVLFDHDELTERGKYKRSSRTLVRLTVLSADTGARGKTITLYSPTKKRSQRDYVVYAPAGHLAWARHPTTGLQLVDLRAPAILMDHKQLEAKLGALGQHKVQGAQGRIAKLIMADGSLRDIDMAQVMKSPPPKPQFLRPTYSCGQSWGYRTSCRRSECIGFGKVPGSTARQLGYAAAGASRNEPAPASATPTPLLRPALISQLPYRCAFESNGKLLVSHVSSAIGPSPRKLSLIDRKGQVEWTVPVAARPYRTLGAVTHNGGVLLFLRGEKKRGRYLHISADGKILADRPLLTNSND